MHWKTYDFKKGKIGPGRKVGEILKGDNFKCGLCAGTGVLPRTKGTKCHICGGSGVVSLTGPAVLCAYCKGRGEYPPRTNITCHVCRAKGWLMSPSRSRYAVIVGEPAPSPRINCPV